MPYCLKCSGEFGEAEVICPECSVDLQAEMPPEMSEEYQEAEWVELHTFQGSLYAQMAVEMLLREGIPAYSQSDFSGGHGYVTYGLSEYGGETSTVFVSELDLDRSEDAIESMIDDLPHPFEEEADE